MTTFTITDDDLAGINKQTFPSVKAFLEHLENECGFFFLYRMPDEEITPEIQKKANEAVKQYEKDPSSFTNI
ncbi:MAG: hypothetical protein AAB489_05680 [Patescibacteria group bacterium]